MSSIVNRPRSRGSRPAWFNRARLLGQRLESREFLDGLSDWVASRGSEFLAAPVDRPATASVELATIASASGLFPGKNVNLSNSVSLEEETTVAIDPTNPARIFVASNFESADRLFAAYSSDGGQSWNTRQVANGADGLLRACCDPSATFDQFGNLFLTYLTNAADSHVAVALSTDGGATFRRVVDLGPGDQPTIASGPANPASAPGQGRVWVTYSAGSGGIMATGARVTGLDQVGAFGTAQRAPDSTAGNFGDIVVGPQGQVMVTWQGQTGSQGPAPLFVCLDPDGLGGAPFGPRIFVGNSNVGGFDYLPAQPKRGVDAELGLAWDRSGGAFTGRVYLVYTDEIGNESNDTDIFLRWSDNQGGIWSSPVRVNDDFTSGSQILPRLAIDQTSGNIAVVWYDARNDRGDFGAGDTDGRPNTDVQVYAAISKNNGISFGPNARISVGIMNASYDILDTIDFGDYLGLAFHGGVLFPAWTDNSSELNDNPFARSFKEIATAKVEVIDRLDRFEPNDFGFESTSLGSLSGTRVEAGLSLDHVGDEDWYEFSSPLTGTATATVASDHRAGELVIEVYDFNTLVASADNPGSDQQTVTFPVVANPDLAEYRIRVTGKNGQTSPAYQLTLRSEEANLPPRFTLPGDPTRRLEIPEDSGVNTYLITNIDDGNTYLDQALTVVAISENVRVLTAAVEYTSPQGTAVLRLTPTPGATDEYVYVNIIVFDDGQENQGAADYLFIHIAPVNDPPTFDLGPDVSVPSTGHPVELPNWLANLSPGPFDERFQSVVLSVSVDSPFLFSQLPTVSPDGTLAFTPALGATGKATVTVQARDDGGTDNGGQDTSPPLSFSITLLPQPSLLVKRFDTVIADGDETPSAADDTDFGGHGVNDSAQWQNRIFTLTNKGSAPLDLGTISLDGGGGNWTIREQPNVVGSSTARVSRLLPGDSAEFRLRYNPVLAGVSSTRVLIPSNDPDQNPYDFVVRGLGLAAGMEVRRLKVVIEDGDTTPSTGDGTDFGNALVGDSASRVTVVYTIANTGTFPLSLAAGVQVTGDTGSFVVTQQPVQNLAPGGTTTFKLRFGPDTAALRTATVSIANNDPHKNPYDFRVQGRGVSSLLGDANGDGSVGAADYAVWSAQFGQSGLGFTADFDGNGTVGASDYALWAANFGRTIVGGEARYASHPAVETEPIAVGQESVCLRRPLSSAVDRVLADSPDWCSSSHASLTRNESGSARSATRLWDRVLSEWASRPVVALAGLDGA